MSADWILVIPVKGTAGAKSRLGGDPEHRSALAQAIAVDSVAAASAATAVARLVVVTDSAVAPIFEALGAEVVVDAGNGLNAAVRQGIQYAQSSPHGQTNGAQRIAILLGDVPALQPEELSAALDAAAAHTLAVVPDADGDGSVLITATAGAEHHPSFGADSFAAHSDAGYVALTVPANSGLRRDVDTLDQLRALDPTCVGPRTALLLDSVGGSNGVSGQLAAGVTIAHP
ncbi:MAG TPA: 2-phospho-L-lactate guanylyltransferase [Glaciihabitans sp.]|nr:2-phospho-L-lactate guanylyltransferase [Glaciihabitans sp.]